MKNQHSYCRSMLQMARKDQKQSRLGIPPLIVNKSKLGGRHGDFYFWVLPSNDPTTVYFEGSVCCAYKAKFKAICHCLDTEFPIGSEKEIKKRVYSLSELKKLNPDWLD